MAVTNWGLDATSDFLSGGGAGDQTGPVVADSGGGAFGVAWTSTAGVTVKFYDVVGQVDPALGTIQLTTSSLARDVSLTAGGAVGYAAAWEESGQLMARYVGLSGPLGGVFAIAPAAGFAQHDVATSGYFIDGASGKPVVDGFNAVWVATSAADGLSAAQISDGYGRIMLQRFAVPLDDKVDPLGPPAAAGLDGQVGGDGDAAVNVGNEAGAGTIVVGRDPNVITTHDGETIITWVDVDNRVHVRAYDLAGNIIDGGITGALLSNLGTVNAGTEAKIVDLAGSGFAIAWVSGINIVGRVFAGAGGSFTAGPLQAMQFVGAGFNGDFNLGTLIDSGGFSLSWAQGSDIQIKNFTAGGVSDGFVTTVNTTTTGNQSAVSLAGLVGDRIIAVYQDASGGDQDVRAAILDTRADAFGNQIVVGGPGLTINGDDGGNGRIKPIADQLAGTIGNDTLNGLADDDELYGAMGDDTLTGGAGNDLLFGGGGNDVATFSGVRANYVIDHLGGGMFTVTDTRGGTPDGSDTLSGVEAFQFADVTLTAFEILTGITPVTPTAWGWTNADPDTAPDASGTPDTDGFLVNHAPASRAGVQTNAFVADSIGEFIAVAWQSVSGIDPNPHIKGQFFDVIGAPDEFIPNTLNLSDGIGIETNPVIVSGGANSGWGVAFEEIDNAADVTRTIRTNFVGPGQLTGSELSVLAEANVDQHDAALSGSFLDRTLASPVGGSVLPTGMSEGYNVVWVSTHLDGSDGALPAGYGRIMMQRFEVPLDPLGNPGAPVAGGIDGIAGLDGLNVSSANDGAVWVANALGRNPSTAALHGFETATIWIESNGAGGERVAGRAWDDLGQEIAIPGFDDISAGFDVAAGTNAIVVQDGAVNFGIVWVTTDGASPSGLAVVGNLYAPTGTGLNGTGFGFAAPAPFKLFDLPAGVAASDLQLAATSINGEDSEDLIVSWKSTAGGDADVLAQHVAVALDPISGLVIAMVPEGDIIRVNAEAGGNQDGGTLAGLLGERFVSVYHDDNATYTDGNDIVARIIDTRDPVNPTPIVGDLVRNGAPQARRDVLVGTNGNDSIRGDISDADGRVDYIFAGMGDDTIQGGPGLRGAAGIPEIINGGEGSDIAVFTGRRQDYSITVNGDGSIEVIDQRPDSDANGDPLQHDGIDNLYEIETLRFLNLTQADPNPAVPPAPTDVVIDLPGTPPAPPAGYDGTPVAWSLDDTSAKKEIAVDHSGGTQSGISATNLQDGAGLAWVAGGTHVFAITYDTTGRADPILLGANTELTDATSAIFNDNLASGIDVAMTGGLGMTTVWESTDVDGDDSGDTSIHLAFASTNTHIVLDPGGGVPGPGLPGGEIVVVGSDGAGVADAPIIQGYEIVNVDNDTLEVGFHVGYVMKASAASLYGVLQLARYEIPVYDLLVDGNGLPILDGDGQGQLATDIFGNHSPATAASFGVGSETAPISIGFDGLRGTADDGQALVLTDGGSPIQGRNLSIGSLHDGQLVVTYIGSDEQVHLKIYVPSVDEVGDRETGGLGGVDVVATGITTYSELALPPAMSAGLGTVANTSQTAFVVPQQNGSFGIFWAAANGSDIDIQGIIYSGAGTAWSPSPVITFEAGLPAGTHFQVAITGVTPGGLEDGFFVSWEAADGTITGQRFDMAGGAVGGEVDVGDAAGGTAPLHSSTGIDDGRMLVAYQDGDDVSAQFLDNREPGVALIGPRTGAPRDVIAGTVGDDAIDGRALGDELYGGLGNDLVTMGSGADIGFGGLGNDTIIGGTGQDQLLGEDGDDLLWGGLSGPADPQVDRDLVDGLTAAGVSAALIASNPGADILSGGDGNDTISFQSEFGRFNIDLSTGIVTSDRAETGGFILEDVIGQVQDDGAGGTIFTFINDIENATGGIGDDTIVGSAGDNVLDGGLGNNVIDGLGGNDTVIIHGAFEDYAINYNGPTNTFTFIDADHIEVVRNVETFVFEGGVTKSLADLIPGPIASADTTTVNEDGSVTIDVLANDTNVGGATITAINGTSIAMGGSVTVLNGSVTLTSTGTGSERLVFAPVADYFGPASFDYTVMNGSGHFSTAVVSVNVANTEDAPTDLVFNGNTTTTAASLNENSANGTVVATLSTLDPDNANGVVNDTFTYTLASNFGGRFQIVGNEIRVQNGTLLDYESGPRTFALGVTSNDGHGGTIFDTITVNLADVNEAPTDIIFGGNVATTSASVIETGGTVTTLSATDPEGGALTFSLADNAEGRFAAVGNQIVVANAALIDFEDPTNPSHAFSVKVMVRDALGASRVETLSITATNAAENAVGGATAGDNTLNGTAGSDILNGLAGRDTMNGLGGNDTYFIDNSGDKINENANAGIDTVYVTGLTSYTLGNNLENLLYTGAANGTTWRGNAAANTVAGGSGNDRIQGDGGDDTLLGRGGNDNIAGDGGNDRIFGGAGNDVIDGGAGNDTVDGGFGNDTLNVGSGNDSVVLQAGFGNDAVTGFDADAAGGQDLLDLSAYGFTVADFEANVVIAGNATVTSIAIGSDFLTLANVNVANVDRSDFFLG